MRTPFLPMTAAASVAAALIAAGPASANQSDSAAAAPLSLAAKAANSVAAQLGLGPDERLIPKDAIRDPDGTTHLRYDRSYRGMPVYGGDLVVTKRPNGALADRRLANQFSLRVSTQARQNPDQAARSALASQRQIAYEAGQPRKVVYASGQRPVLAYETVLRGIKPDQTPSRLHVLTDAATGKVLSSTDEILNVEGTGNTQYSGKVKLETTQSGSSYQLVDGSRGGQSMYDLNHAQTGKGKLMTDEDNVWGDGKATTPQTAGADAAYGSSVTWDFYRDVLGREGIKGDGKGTYSRVHYGQNYSNAFWDDECGCMTYGDGPGNAKPFTEIDVTGHEMSHGVTSATANLEYRGESGGLNEATSDIFGTAVEWQANNPVDKPDYLIGELLDLKGDKKPLRYMDKPSKDGKSLDYWSESAGNANVHHSSGIANHFFYLLSEGSGPKTINGVNYDSPTANGQKMGGIGRDKAVRIWYAALTKYFTSTTDYHGAREGTMKAANDLFGADSAETKAVDAAWDAVKVTG